VRAGTERRTQTFSAATQTNGTKFTVQGVDVGELAETRWFSSHDAGVGSGGSIQQVVQQ